MIGTKITCPKEKINTKLPRSRTATLRKIWEKKKKCPTNPSQAAPKTKTPPKN